MSNRVSNMKSESPGKDWITDAVRDAADKPIAIAGLSLAILSWRKFRLPRQAVFATRPPWPCLPATATVGIFPDDGVDPVVLAGQMPGKVCSSNYLRYPKNPARARVFDVIGDDPGPVQYSRCPVPSSGTT